MILFSLGPYGPFAAWWDAVITRIAEAGLGPATVMGADEPDGLAANLIRSTAPNLVATSRRPSPRLRTLLAESGAPLLVGLGDPREGLHEIVVGHGHALRVATQVVGDCCAAAMVCAGLPRALTIRADEARRDPAAAINRVAQFCGLTAPPDLAGIPPPPEPSAPAREWWEGLGAEERALADGALGAYASWLTGRGFGEITWDRKLFRCAADPERDGGTAIDIGDAPRLLFDGPWIGLPPGHWAASVTLAVSREISTARFDIAIHASDHPGPLATTSIVPDGRGLGSATLLFTVAPTSGQTIAFAIVSALPAPGGRLALGNVVLTPGPTEGAGIPAELSTALSLA